MGEIVRWPRAYYCHACGRRGIIARANIRAFSHSPTYFAGEGWAACTPHMPAAITAAMKNLGTQHPWVVTVYYIDVDVYGQPVMKRRMFEARSKGDRDVRDRDAQNAKPV